MKVITQLVRYFWQRGALTPREIQYLVRHGFIRPHELPGYKPPKVTAPVLLEREERAEDAEKGEAEAWTGPRGDWDFVEETLVRRTAPRRRGESQPKGKVLSIKELLARLEEEFERRDDDLASVHSLGRHFAECGNWHEAAIELRQLSVDRFYRGMCAGLRSEAVLLGDLWQAVEPEPFHELVDDDEVRGRAVRAFLAMLVADGPSELGRYAWILKHEPARAMLNLRVVHLRLLRVMQRLYQKNRPLLSRAITRNCDRIQFWALVLLYNAHRTTPRPKPVYGREYGPLALPEEEPWLQAWTWALKMDPPAVTKLLVACYGDDRLEGDERIAGCRRPLMCPVGWHEPDEE